MNKEFWTEFLNLYRDHPELWEIKNENYKNKRFREKSWEIITEKLREIDPAATVITAKKKINAMRTCFRRELTKIERSGPASYTPQLWYFDLLTFLSNQESYQELSKNLTINDFEGNDEEYFEIREMKYASPSPLPHHEIIRDQEHYYDYHPKIKRKRFLQQAIDHLEEDLSNDMFNNNKFRKERDEADIYAESWAVSYRKLSEEQKLYAKKAIDEVLIQGQLGTLTLQLFEPSNFCSISTSIDANNQILTNETESTQQVNNFL